MFGLTSRVSNARITATNQSCGVRNFRTSSRHASGSSTSARATTFRSPSLDENAFATRSTAAAGGSSLTKCVTSLVATKRAVDGCRQSVRIAVSPSSMPASLYRSPSTVLLPGSCSSSWKTKPTGVPGSGRAALRLCRRVPTPTPQLGAALLRHAVAGTADAAHRPSGEDLGQLLHVLLRVAAVDAERVQLEQLARVVLVQAAALAVGAAARARAPREFGPIDWKLSRYTSMAGCFADAMTMSSKRPSTCVPDDVALVAAGERRH